MAVGREMVLNLENKEGQRVQKRGKKKNWQDLKINSELIQKGFKAQRSN